MKQGVVPEDYTEDYMKHMIYKLITLKREGEKIMKKILQLTKAITLTLAAVIMLLNTNVLTAYAGTMMFPGMTKTEDGRILVNSGTNVTDSTGRNWSMNNGYPYCVYKEEYEVTKHGITVICYDIYLDCYLTDIIRTCDESEWPSFVVIGSDGIPFYYSRFGESSSSAYYSKFCYDKESGWWLEDRAYKGPNAYANTPEEVTEETKTAIENGETINGEPVDPIPADTSRAAEYNPDDGTITYSDGRVEYPDGHTEYPDGRVEYTYKHDDHDDKRMEYPDGRKEYYCKGEIIRTEYPDGRILYPDGRMVYPDGHVEYIGADFNSLGATVTFKTDCIKTKKNNAPQKPLPKSVKVGKKALKRNKNYTVSYEKYAEGWKTVDAVTDEGIYRVVITGKGDYKGEYKKTVYVTADKEIKAMSSVSVKVNKMEYTGKPVESGVIKTAKIGKRTLEEGVDFAVTYINNTDSGTAQLILTAIEGKGLLGTKTVNFTITGNKLSKAKVTGINSMTYNPNEKMEQDMSNVKLTYNGENLTKDTDFTISYVNNTKAGTAKIVFTGKGLYYGTLTKSFKITKAQLSNSMLDEASKNIEVTYTGKAVKPNITLKDGETTLNKGTDYTLTYKNNKKVSTDAAPAQIIVKGKGSYTGSFKVDFAIIAKSNGADEKSNAKGIKPDEEDDNLTEDEAVVDEPTEDEAETDEPATDETVSDEPTEEEPVTDETTGDESATDETTGDEPATDNSTGNESATDEPTEEEPAATDESTGDESAATDETTGDESVTDGATEDDPVTNEPIGDESVTDEPTEEETVTDEATGDDLVTDEPTEDKPATDANIIVDLNAETAPTVETTEQ